MGQQHKHRYDEIVEITDRHSDLAKDAWRTALATIVALGAMALTVVVLAIAFSLGDQP